jgi:hypothetical protein
MSAPLDPPVPPVPGPFPDPTAPAPPPAAYAPTPPAYPPAAYPPAPPAPGSPVAAAPAPPAVPNQPPSLFEQTVWNVPPPPRRRRWWAWTLPVVPILLLAVCAYGSHVLGLNDGNTGGGRFNNPDAGQNSNPVTLRLADAFDRTTAAGYPQGVAGIEVPTAAAVPGFTAAEVKADLEKVRQLLIAGRTDQKLMTGYDVSALIAMYAKDSRADLQTAFDKHDFLSYATLIAKGQSYSGIVRDKGTITFAAETGSKGGQILKVTANFVWVYGFLGTYKKPGDHLVSLREQTSWRFFSPKDFEVAQGDMYLYQSEYFGYNIDCELFKGGFLALGQPTPTKPGATGDPDKEFAQVLDPGTSMGSFTNSC